MLPTAIHPSPDDIPIHICTGPAIIIGGPLPPPIQGAAVVTSRMAETISAQVPAIICDLSADELTRGVRYHLRRCRRVLATAWTIVTTKSLQRLLLSLDGGLGLTYSVLLILAARLRRLSLFLYHHSSRYINDTSPLMIMVTWIAGPEATHVMCSEAMIELFRNRYPHTRRFFQVGNAAFIDPPANVTHSTAGGMLTFGMLSNLCRAKGLDLALDTLRLTLEQGLPCRLLLAGPVLDDEAQRLIDRAKIKLGPAIKLLGPVSGQAKDTFFRRLDVFLFPSAYPHETQSLVVPEALSYGVPVLTCAHRFIAELGDGSPALSILPQGAGFSSAAAALMTEWNTHSDMLEQARAAASVRFAQLHEEAADALLELERKLTRTREQQAN